MAQKSNTSNSGAAAVKAGAPAKVAAVTATAPAKRERDGDMRLESNDAVWENKRNIGRLSGNVKITQDGEDFILYADNVIYNKTANQADCKGHLRVETKDSTIVSDLIHADFDAKVITLTGNVTMRSHGEDDGMKAKASVKKTGDDKKGDDESRSLRGEVLHKPSRMVCTKIEYNYENREALITGNIRMTQEKNVGLCSKILFDEENNIAKLEGNVIFTQSDGRTIETPTMTVWIDEDKILAPQDAKIKIPREKKEGTPAPRAPKTDLGIGKSPTIPEADIPGPTDNNNGGKSGPA